MQKLLSTTWRNLSQRRKELWGAFSKAGLSREELIISDKYEGTPDLSPLQHRTDEIVQTLDDINKRIEVCSWVALDDMELLAKGKEENRARMGGHFIQCDPELGLTDEQTIEAITILN